MLAARGWKLPFISIRQESRPIQHRRFIEPSECFLIRGGGRDTAGGSKWRAEDPTKLLVSKERGAARGLCAIFALREFQSLESSKESSYLAVPSFGSVLVTTEASGES